MVSVSSSDTCTADASLGLIITAVLSRIKTPIDIKVFMNHLWKESPETNRVAKTFAQHYIYSKSNQRFCIFYKSAAAARSANSQR